MELFGTAGVRGDAEETVTPALTQDVGRAVGLDARDHGVEEVVLGRDGRVTGPALAAAVESGVLSAGVDVRRAGVLPTPALAYASLGGYGVMLTASHNPPADNGIKLFSDGVEFGDDAEARIEELVGEERGPASWQDWGESEPVDPLVDYRNRVSEYAETVGAALDGLPVAVDCGTGTAGLATPQVLGDLGADVTAVNANVDGHFPARPSKPTAESLAAFRSFVAEGNFALGFGHDGDADRIVIVDAGGEVVHEDTVLAILAEYYVDRSEVADPVVVTTPNASARIDERVTAAGGRTTRVALGALHVGVGRVRASGGHVVFAAEPWKHIHPDLGGWIDGVASAVVLARLVAEAGSLEALTAPVDERPYRKDEVHCPESRKRDAMSSLESALPGAFPDARVNTEHGIRLDRPDSSWVLVRPSGTEPVIRLYAEGDDVDELVDTARTAVERAVSQP